MRARQTCSIPTCWNFAKVSGMCGACYSWWWRVTRLTASELDSYLRKQDRNEARVRNAPHRRALKRAS